MASDVLSSRAAAEFLALHEKTVTRKAREGSLPASKVGRRWCFSRKQLTDWLAERGWPSEEEVDRALVELVRQRMADPENQKRKPWAQVKAELGL